MTIHRWLLDSRVACVMLTGSLALLCPTATLASQKLITNATRVSASPRAARNTHLYIAAGYFDSAGIYRFPLTDGLPATRPDAVLRGGLIEPRSLGFDAAGYLYVLETHVSFKAVKVYPPGATGDALPIRMIRVQAGPQWLAVSPAGYVFVTGPSHQINVFAPGAGSRGTSIPSPVHVITPGHCDIWDLKVDSRGRLYANDDCNHIFVYDDPVNHWQAPDQVITSQGGFEGQVSNPIALLEEDDLLYFHVYAHVHLPLGLGDYAARSLAPKNTQPDKVTLTADCHTNGDGQEYGLAVDRKYLIYACDEVQRAVFVYHNRPGRQELVEKIPLGAYNMIFGP